MNGRKIDSGFPATLATRRVFQQPISANGLQSPTQRRRSFEIAVVEATLLMLAPLGGFLMM